MVLALLSGVRSSILPGLLAARVCATVSAIGAMAVAYAGKPGRGRRDDEFR